MRLWRAGVPRARVDVSVDPAERHVGITVNEYETLLMQHDLVSVLKDPLRFARLDGHSDVANPLRDALGKSRRISFLAGVNGHVLTRGCCAGATRRRSSCNGGGSPPFPPLPLPLPLFLLPSSPPPPLLPLSPPPLFPPLPPFPPPPLPRAAR